jgi:hypothetical protein
MSTGSPGSATGLCRQWGCMSTALTCLRPTVRVRSRTASIRDPAQRFLIARRVPSELRRMTRCQFGRNRPESTTRGWKFTRRAAAWPAASPGCSREVRGKARIGNVMLAVVGTAVFLALCAGPLVRACGQYLPSASRSPGGVSGRRRIPTATRRSAGFSGSPCPCFRGLPFFAAALPPAARRLSGGKPAASPRQARGGPGSAGTDSQADGARRAISVWCVRGRSKGPRAGARGRKGGSVRTPRRSRGARFPEAVR